MRPPSALSYKGVAGRSSADRRSWRGRVTAWRLIAGEMMNCPYDAVELQLRRLESDVDVEVCPVCGGTWLSEGELRALQDTHAHDHLRPAQESVAAAFEMAEQTAREPGPCPVCDETLGRREYAYTSQVLIDVCPRGHGLWLDSGELSRLEQFFAGQRHEAPEPTPLRQLWARVVAALSGEKPIG